MIRNIRINKRNGIVCTKGHFIIYIVIVSNFFAFHPERVEEGSIIAPIPKGSTEVKMNQSQPMVNNKKKKL